MSAKTNAKERWISKLTKATDFDQWGQSLEASEAYQDILRDLGSSSKLNLTVDERSILAKSKALIKARAKAITSPNIERNDAGLLPVKDLVKAFEALFTGKEADVAIEVKSGINLYADSIPNLDDNKVKSFGETTLLPPPKHIKKGCQSISVNIESIGLKDAPSYFDPFISVSLVTADGKIHGQVQDTKKSHNNKDKHVIFHEKVHMQESLETILKEDMSIFFEFKHYKPKKKYVSTRCFTFMEGDEIKSSLNQKSTQLELYKKPTRLLKKPLNLFSIKKLYLNISVVAHKH